VLGVLQPKLLWPERLSDRLTDAELDSLLAHEMCHVRRRDNLSAMIHVVVETLFWFHPAVWWVGSRLVSERERACDEEVLQMGADNRSYAEGILKVCSFGFRAPVAFVAGVGGPRLADRIEWILERQNATPLSGPARLLFAAVVAVTLGAPVAAGALSASRGPVHDGPSGNISPQSVQERPKAYRPGGDVKPPRLVSEVKPHYTPEAMEARIQGSLKLEAVVLDTGDVGDVEVTQSLDDIYGLDNEAVKALKQWRFEPGTKDGKPVAVLIEVEMSFTLK
jgi:TonB family protein